VCTGHVSAELLFAFFFFAGERLGWRGKQEGKGSETQLFQEQEDIANAHKTKENRMKSSIECSGRVFS
jgi:hypothetical protein